MYDLYGSKNLTLYRGFVVGEMGLMVILSIVLNSYWFWLMIKMLLRVAKRTLNP